MDSSIMALAASAVQFMSPYLKDIGESASKKLGEKLFDFFSKQVASRPEAKASLEKLQANPDNGENQTDAAAKLCVLLNSDAILAESVRLLIASSPGTHIQITTGDDANVAGQVFGSADFSRHGKSK